MDSSYKLNKDRYRSAFDRYIKELTISDWLTVQEIYKFRFANWLYSKVNLKDQSDEEILTICEESQRQKYQPGSTEKGVNFITQIKRHADYFITKADIEAIRKISETGSYTETDLNNVTLSYPKFSIWLSCFLPEHYNTYSSNELDTALSYLFDNDSLPKSGFKAFETSQMLLRELRGALQDNEAALSKSILPILNKNELEPIDWVWITQDFNLFVVRRICSTMANYWWVCQGYNYKVEKDAGLIWAPDSSQHHHKRLKELRKGDQLIHYSDKFIRATSTVVEEYKDAYHPIPSVYSDVKGLLVKVDYHEISPISIERVFSVIPKNELPSKYSPLNAVGVNQGYLFPFTKTAFEILFQSSEQLTPHSSMVTNQPSKYPLNQILYGPPGTGKTYHTLNRAIQIIEGLDEEALKSIPRQELRARFEHYLGKGQIAFCTFHQSFSYEDFIEGIKPVFDKEEEKNTTLLYEVVNGVFKSLVLKAESYQEYNKKAVAQQVALTNLDLTKIDFYKMSLGDTKDTDDEGIYQYCIRHNCIALGWGNDTDFSQATNKQEVGRLIKENSELSTYAITAVHTFRNDIQLGDIVVISKGNLKIRAIAKVVGEYEYRPKEEIRYRHFRKVEWLIKDEIIPVNEFFTKNLSQQTIYYLDKNLINKSFFQQKLATKAVEPIEVPTIPNYVLIIDEINRGNVSQIFGELITLIEEDKRKGKKEALSLILPYSKTPFSVPSNLYLIGTMNTADRSVEALDTALRRRFSFVEMAPQPELISPAALISNLWRAWDKSKWDDSQYQLQAAKLFHLLEPNFIGDAAAQEAIYDSLGNDWDMDTCRVAFKDVEFTGIDPEVLLKTVNRRIEKLIDKDHCIGHSYFLSLSDCQDPIKEVRNIFANKIIPLLQEYFYGDIGKIGLVIGKDFFDLTSTANGTSADTFFAKFDHEYKADLYDRKVYKLKDISVDTNDFDFIKSVKNIYQ